MAEKNIPVESQNPATIDTTKSTIKRRQQNSEVISLLLKNYRHLKFLKIANNYVSWISTDIGCLNIDILRKQHEKEDMRYLFDSTLHLIIFLAENVIYFELFKP